MSERQIAMEFGYAGKILKIVLPRGDIIELPTSIYASRFLGGRGIAAKIYWDEVSPEIKAFDPDNELIFITGPLAGFSGLAGSRWQICGKSPTIRRESFSYANIGGSWGANLKFAGYDGLIISGKSDKPVYVFIHNGKIEIRDAAFVWGKNTIETQEILRRIHGSSTKVASIGPAGENLVTMAIILADQDSAGSAGFGAVMGSKKLKAIAIQGDGRLKPADTERLQELKKYIRELTRGMPTLIAAGYRNSFLEKNPKMSKAACWGCIGGCARSIYTADDGKKGKFMCQAALFYFYAATKYYGNANDVPFYAARLCDEYGLDTTAIERIMVWLSMCYREGILNDVDTGIPISKVGSREFIETLISKISNREGFGDILAKGVLAAAEIVGERAKIILGSSITKTGHYYQYSPRLYITTGISYATEPRMPITQLHQVSKLVHQWIDWVNKIEGAFVSTEVVRSIARKYYGNETTFDFSTYDEKAHAAKIIQDREYAKECLILCDFMWPIRYVKHATDHVGDPTIESKILSAIIGKDIDVEGLRKIGERVFNLQRAILIREGHSGRTEDTLPESDFTVPLKLEIGNPEGLLPGKDGEIISRKGAVVNRNEFEKMKDEYYKLRGWDIETGLQMKKKLNELELYDIARELEVRGLLINSST